MRTPRAPYNQRSAFMKVRPLNAVSAKEHWNSVKTEWGVPIRRNEAARLESEGNNVYVIKIPFYVPSVRYMFPPH